MSLGNTRMLSLIRAGDGETNEPSGGCLRSVDVLWQHRVGETDPPLPSTAMDTPSLPNYQL